MRYLPPLLLTVLAGCIGGRVSVGEPVDRTALEQLAPGKTTAAEVTELLGPPRLVVDLAPRSAYLYESSKSRVAGLMFVVVNFVNFDQRFDRIWLFFDEHNVLTHYGAKLASHRARWAMPWRDLQDPEKNAKRDAKRAEQERLRRSGEPAKDKP